VVREFYNVRYEIGKPEELAKSFPIFVDQTELENLLAGSNFELDKRWHPGHDFKEVLGNHPRATEKMVLLRDNMQDTSPAYIRILERKMQADGVGSEPGSSYNLTQLSNNLAEVLGGKAGELRIPRGESPTKRLIKAQARREFMEKYGQKFEIGAVLPNHTALSFVHVIHKPDGVVGVVPLSENLLKSHGIKILLFERFSADKWNAYLEKIQANFKLNARD
jgi:hypothetical protein